MESVTRRLRPNSSLLLACQIVHNLWLMLVPSQSSRLRLLNEPYKNWCCQHRELSLGYLFSTRYNLNVVASDNQKLSSITISVDHLCNMWIPTVVSRAAATFPVLVTSCGRETRGSVEMDIHRPTWLNQGEYRRRFLWKSRFRRRGRGYTRKWRWLPVTRARPEYFEQRQP